MADEVLTEYADGVVTVTINRPEARNAINGAVAEGVAAAMAALDGRDDLRVGILTGAGGTFCAGMDLKAFLRGERPSVQGRGFAGLAEAPPRKPLIAAVEGYALAGGCELALACDLIVASEAAQFGIPEVKRGLAAGAGGLWRLPRQVPMRIAMEMALTGDFIDARRAAGYGLVNRLVAPGEALAEARRLAAAITANAPLSIIASKRVIIEQQDWPQEEVWRRQEEILAPIMRSADAREGAAAFAEKRKPAWKGA